MTLSRRSLAEATGLLAWLALVHWSSALQVMGPTLFLLLAAIAIGAVLFFMPAAVSKSTRVVALVVCVCGIVFIQHVLPILFGPDAQAYYSQASYQDSGTLIDAFKRSFGIRFGAVADVRVSFPLFLKVLLGPLVDVGPWAIAFVNVLLWGSASLRWADAVYRRYSTGSPTDRRSTDIMFVLLTCSPSAIYWAAVFGKDLIVTALTVFAAVAMFDRKYVRALLIIAMASLMRPYAAPLALVFFMFLDGNGRRIYYSIILVAIAFGITSLPLVVNWIAISGYTFISPNPISSSNWLMYHNDGTWTLSPLWFLTEGLALSVILILAVGTTITRHKRHKLLYLALACITLCAAINALDGYVLHKLDPSDPFGIGLFGDNMLRKKFVSWPLVMTFTGWVIGHTVFHRSAVNHETGPRTQTYTSNEARAQQASE